MVVADVLASSDPSATMAEVLRLPATQKPPATGAEFFDLLEQGEGSVQVVGPPDTVRAAWRRFLHAVKQSSEVPSGWHLRWTDYARRRVEDDLSEVLREIERRAAAVRAEREARQWTEQQRLAEERQRRILQRRDKVLRAEVAAWRLAKDVRAHCDELVAAGTPADDPWLVWAREYALGIDPLRYPPGPPPDPSPTAENDDEPWAAPARGPAVPAPPLPRPWHPNRRWYHN